MLVAVDPSLRSAGVAVFGEAAGDLRFAARVTLPYSAAECGARAENMAHKIKTTIPMALRPLVDVVVYEWPQIYTRSKSKGDPNDLIALAAIGAAFTAMMNAPIVKTPTPAEWAGQLPKTTKGDPWASPRAARVAARLTPAERVLVPDSHDAIDAVALGLWALGRFAPRRGRLSGVT